jgi:hypothetical protein
LSAAILFGLASFVPFLRLFRVEEANGIVRMLGMLLGRTR